MNTAVAGVMSDSENRRITTLKHIPPLMPRFLKRRRAGLPAVREIMGELGLEPPVFFWLVTFHELQGAHAGRPVSLGQVRARQPYTTRHTYEEPLGILLQKGLITKDAAGELSMSPEALGAINRLHRAGREYVAGLRLLPEAELAPLVEQLERTVSSIVKDDTLHLRLGSRLAGSRSLSVQRSGAPLMVRLEQAIFELWKARDDAHIKAWSDAGLDGPVVAVLTSLWHTGSLRVSELQEAFSAEQTPDDVENSLLYLVENEYVSRDGETVSLTPRGSLLREDIERETDRIYFAPWPQTAEEAQVMLRSIEALVGELDKVRQG